MHSGVALFRRPTWALTVGVTMFLFACSEGQALPERLERFGSVSVGASANPAWTPEPFGMFYRAADQPPESSCTVQVDNGKCRVWSCSEATYATGSSTKTVEAGRIQIKSTIGSIEMTRGEDGFYRLAPPERFWPDGGSLTLQVEGSMDFPKLSTSLPTPLPFAVTEPALTGLPWVIDKSVDLPLKWSGPATGSVVVTISPETTSSEGSEPIVSPGVDCEFPAAAGAAIVPSAFLKMLPTPVGLIQYYLDVFTYTAASAQSEDAWLDFHVSWVGLSAAVTAR